MDFQTSNSNLILIKNAHRLKNFVRESFCSIFDNDLQFHYDNQADNLKEIKLISLVFDENPIKVS